MSKRLGPVDPGPAPVDPFKPPTPGLGVVASREVTVKSAPAVPLGTIKNDEVIVNVPVAPVDPIGQVRQVLGATVAPPPPPPPVGIVEDKTPTVSAIPVTQGASPLGVIKNIVTQVPTPPPPPPVGAVLMDPPIYPPPPPVYKGNVGTVAVPTVTAPQPIQTNEPQKVVSLTVKEKPIIERPSVIDPFRNPED